MPVRKAKLTRQEEGAYLQCLRKLQAEGVKLEIPTQLLRNSSPLSITVFQGFAALAFNTPTGLVGYAVGVRLVAQRPVTLIECQITTPWDDEIVLESPASTSQVHKIGNQEYPTEKILNLRIEEGLRFPRKGHCVEGIILATGLAEIPDHYPHGMVSPCQISFFDQNETIILQDAELLVHRVPIVGLYRIPGQMLLPFDNLIPRDRPEQLLLPFTGGIELDQSAEQHSLGDKFEPMPTISGMKIDSGLVAFGASNLSAPSEVRN